MIAYMAYLPRRADGMYLREETGYLLIDGGVPSSTYNFVCKSSIARDERVAANQIQGVHRYFSEKGQRYGWWTGPSCRPADIGPRLKRSGHVYGGAYPGMVIDLARFEQLPERPQGCTFERVESSLQLRQFASVEGTVFDGGQGDALDYFSRIDTSWIAAESPLQAYVARLQGQAVATCMCFTQGEEAGLYSVATHPGARRRGIAQALTSFALHQACRRGTRLGVLQSSPTGYPLYHRMGFRACGSFDVWYPA